MDLPFELRKKHKTDTKYIWKDRGLICSDEEFEAIYEIYITARKCELCKKKFKSSRNRHMDHDHETGEFRNVCCTKCNQRKRDVKIRTDNTSGYKYIYEHKESTCKQGFIWVFKVWIDGKSKTLKKSVDKEKVIAFRDRWLDDHPDFHT